ncbi:hypothetical protein [Actinobaculum sp. 352]|uniref:hypothetical protein n=1 Tax=Actinobaculum sp. 352 TaxID=2490946 RepID=UPI000F7E697F|nr:hypothetical protein [Actinobaculum sp. 352]RTE50599.1 hypothetical protein EKN07_00095 [Actinobaculum sp. 352]
MTVLTQPRELQVSEVYVEVASLEAAARSAESASDEADGIRVTAETNSVEEAMEGSVAASTVESATEAVDALGTRLRNVLSEFSSALTVAKEGYSLTTGPTSISQRLTGRQAADGDMGTDREVEGV